MIRSLSPSARLDEMHPTLAKFSIPAGGELSERRARSIGGRGGDGRVVDGATSTGGLSLSKAFETIEARKAELQVGCGYELRFFFVWRSRSLHSSMISAFRSTRSKLYEKRFVGPLEFALNETYSWV